jgi:cytochrome P450
MKARRPVTDWFTDFDHLDPRWVEDPYPIWNELRDKCPIAHTERFQGVYFPRRYADVRAIAYDTEHFSSRRIIVHETRPPLIPAPPIISDPPDHRPARSGGSRSAGNPQQAAGERPERMCVRGRPSPASKGRFVLTTRPGDDRSPMRDGISDTSTSPAKE